MLSITFVITCYLIPSIIITIGTIPTAIVGVLFLIIDGTISQSIPTEK